MSTVAEATEVAPQQEREDPQFNRFLCWFKDLDEFGLSREQRFLQALERLGDLQGMGRDKATGIFTGVGYCGIASTILGVRVKEEFASDLKLWIVQSKILKPGATDKNDPNNCVQHARIHLGTPTSVKLTDLTYRQTDIRFPGSVFVADLGNSHDDRKYYQVPPYEIVHDQTEYYLNFYHQIDKYTQSMLMSALD